MDTELYYKTVDPGGASLFPRNDVSHPRMTLAGVAAGTNDPNYPFSNDTEMCYNSKL